MVVVYGPVHLLVGASWWSTGLSLCADLVEAQHGLDALVQEEGLLAQAAPVQRHQLLVEVHGEHVEVNPPIQALRLPQRHRAQGASCSRGPGEVWGLGLLLFVLSIQLKGVEY